MELAEAIRRRKMVRAFQERPVEPDVVNRVLSAAMRAPSAGFSQGCSFVVLEGAETARYWDATLPAAARQGFAWPSLLDAPVLIVVVTHPDTYVQRYAEPDKLSTGLGGDAADWPVPYWHVDAGMAVMNALLTATDEGLGALFFGVFDHEPALRAALRIPESHRVVGTIAAGHPAPDRPSGSLSRGRRPFEALVHRGEWGASPGAGIGSSEPSERGEMAKQIPIVDYLALEPEPHLVANKCDECGALYFDRRNACANCGQRSFSKQDLATEGTVRAYTIVQRAAPGVPSPYTSAVVDLDGGGLVKANVVEIDPDPAKIDVGMRVKLTTYPGGTDDDGTEAIVFGFAPA